MKGLLHVNLWGLAGMTEIEKGQVHVHHSIEVKSVKVCFMSIFF